MNVLSVVVIAAIALLAAYVASRMTYAILTNFHTGRQFRKALGGRVKRLRLYRMLERRGIDAQEYLHRHPVVDIERHIRACEGCGETAVCEKALGSRAPQVDLSFCRNDAPLNAIKPVVPVPPAAPERDAADH
ncbi:MAG: hypothetical protein IT496_12965 [Gammaproteobacteria bacterium]|nr:hypothetical protein [Gammaproteobacteria bacterium]MCG3144790.1 hypothetical protein [Gammaproteobacteria bacterium]